ncbi:MAG: hypothetical protein WC763_01040 [Candidatus Paceibacterota bacterium]|jgi:plastocyanin
MTDPEHIAGEKRNWYRALGVTAVLGLAVFGTYSLSNKLSLSSGNAAAVFMGGGSTHEVSVYSNRFEPSELVARTGDEIVFTVKDEGIHNIAEERQSKGDARLQSDEIRRGDTYSLRFSVPGTVYLYDRMNLDMHMAITVEK